eukprot:jgi/Bigna1/78789/fgenesh1_pg.57_\
MPSAVGMLALAALPWLLLPSTRIWGPRGSPILGNIRRESHPNCGRANLKVPHPQSRFSLLPSRLESTRYRRTLLQDQRRRWGSRRLWGVGALSDERADSPRGPLSGSGGMGKRDSENIEKRTEEATIMITEMYEEVVNGMKSIGLFNMSMSPSNDDIIQALMDGKDLDELGIAKGDASIDDIVSNVVSERLEALDEYFLAVLNTYIWQIRQTTVDQTVSLVLSAIREEVLVQITERLPGHFQLIQRLSEISDEDEWSQLLAEALGVDAELFAKSEGIIAKGTAPTDSSSRVSGGADGEGTKAKSVEEIRKDIERDIELSSMDVNRNTMGESETSEGSIEVCGGGWRERLLSAEYSFARCGYRLDSSPNSLLRRTDVVPRCTAEELYLATTQIIDDLEGVAIIPDFRFLIKMVMLREKILDLDGAQALTRNAESPGLAHYISKTRGSFPDKVSSFLSTVTQLADERETQRFLYMTFREKEQATATLKNDDMQETKIDEIRPGEFMGVLTATMTDLATQLGLSANLQALGYTTVLDQEDAKQIDIEDKDDEREKAVLMLKKLQVVR